MADSHTASLVEAHRATPRPHAARLRVIYPRELRWALAVAAAPVTLGRQPDDGTPPLEHATVSRRHAQVWWDVQGHHAVRDTGSRHGTLLGGTPVDATPRVLADGDVLRLGDVLAVYERAADADATDAAVDREALPGAAPAMARLRALVASAAADPSPALILGDTGTGKEWVARELHRLARRPGPLVAVNCATLTRELIESQLFGHVRGAFTGAAADALGLFRQADGGTLFLDEIGELPLALQPRLLRVVQDGVVQPIGAQKPVTVDVRLVAATNRDLTAAVDDGRFRRDLLARLGTWELRVPPLAARRGDVLAWLDRLWQRWHAQRDRAAPPLRLTPAAAALVVAAPWLDNLRGLDRLVHVLGAVVAGEVDVPELPAWLRDGAAPSPPSLPAEPAAVAAVVARPPVPSRDEFVAAWTQLGGSVRAVAKHFGRDRRQIYRWLEAHGLRAPDGDEP